MKRKKWSGFRIAILVICSSTAQVSGKEPGKSPFWFQLETMYRPTGVGSPLTGARDEFAYRLARAVARAEERGQLRGGPNLLTSFYRSPSYDAQIERGYGEKRDPSTPGPHDTMLSADVSGANVTDWRGYMATLKEDGLYLPFPWDPVHVEPMPATDLFDARSVSSRPEGRQLYRGEVTRLLDAAAKIAAAGESSTLSTLLPYFPTRAANDENDAMDIMAKFFEDVAPILRRSKDVASAFNTLYKTAKTNEWYTPGSTAKVPASLQKDYPGASLVSDMPTLSQRLLQAPRILRPEYQAMEALKEMKREALERQREAEKQSARDRQKQEQEELERQRRAEEERKRQQAEIDRQQRAKADAALAQSRAELAIERQREREERARQERDKAIKEQQEAQERELQRQRERLTEEQNSEEPDTDDYPDEQGSIPLLMP